MNPGEQRREHQGQTEAETCPCVRPVRSLRWRARGSELDRRICGRNEPLAGGPWWPVSVDHGDVGKEPVAAASYGLYEARVLRRVAQRFTHLVDSFVQAVIEVDDRLAPNFLAQFLPGDQLCRFFQQHRQDLKRLLLQPDAQAALLQLAGSKID